MSLPKIAQYFLNANQNQGYDIKKEWCGYLTKYYNVYFCGEVVGTYRFLHSALNFICSHRKEVEESLIFGLDF